jgi:hypothetical protein
MKRRKLEAKYTKLLQISWWRNNNSRCPITSQTHVGRICRCLMQVLSGLLTTHMRTAGRKMSWNDVQPFFRNGLVRNVYAQGHSRKFCCSRSWTLGASMRWPIVHICIKFVWVLYHIIRYVSLWDSTLIQRMKIDYLHLAPFSFFRLAFDVAIVVSLVATTRSQWTLYSLGQYLRRYSMFVSRRYRLFIIPLFFVL